MGWEEEHAAKIIRRYAPGSEAQLVSTLNELLWGTTSTSHLSDWASDPTANALHASHGALHFANSACCFALDIARPLLSDRGRGSERKNE
jgi:hypothetical protein